jgi:hypothetical protein
VDGRLRGHDGVGRMIFANERLIELLEKSKEDVE